MVECYIGSRFNRKIASAVVGGTVFIVQSTAFLFGVADGQQVDTVFFDETVIHVGELLDLLREHRSKSRCGAVGG
ncbi:MAG: hypothetical protein ABSE80_13820 [Halobacteriota archaeon]|jgi:hypothetical protein